MAEGQELFIQKEPRSLVDMYTDPNYITLYRYENPNIPYVPRREGTVSKKGLVGTWFTDNLDDLKAYALMRIKGQKGGIFVVVRVKKDDLGNYGATKLPETKDMDIEPGNYIIPEQVRANSRVEMPAFFKSS